MALQKVECVDCKSKFFISPLDVPEDAESGEAFPCHCIYCDYGRYAALVPDKKAAKKKA